MTFDCMLRLIVELNGYMSYFFLKCYNIRHEDGVGIVAVGSTRFFYLKIEKDGIVYGLIDLLSGLGFFITFFTMTITICLVLK